MREELLLTKATVHTVHAKPIFRIKRENTIGKMTPVAQLSRNLGANRIRREEEEAYLPPNVVPAAMIPDPSPPDSVLGKE